VVKKNQLDEIAAGFFSRAKIVSTKFSNEYRGFDVFHGLKKLVGIAVAKRTTTNRF
jgi:hypothetical protein